MNRKDFLLLAVAAAEGNPLTPVQIQKIIFLIGKADLKESPTPYYEFEPYDYGPFDVSIYRDAEELESEGLVYRPSSSKGYWTDTIISTKGSAAAEALGRQLSKETNDYIKDLTAWARIQSFSALVQYIYENWPEYRENSVFQG